MKVDELQAYLLTWPLPRPLRRPVYGGEVTLFKRDCLLVRARTDRGHTGYGSGTPSPNVAQLINRNLRAAVVGLNPGNLSGLRKKVFQRRPHYPGLVQAFAAIEMALLDLQGQIKSCSLSELLGGRIRQRIRLCASGGVYLDPEEGAREASLWANSGFSACKLGLGCSPSQDLETVRRIRQACPRPWGIAVDARAWWRQNYGLAEIGRLLQEMAPSHLEWVEVPVPLEDLQAIRRLKEVCPIPISGGSAEPSPEGWVDLAARGCLDILQLDVLHLGGLTNGHQAIRSLGSHGPRVAIGNQSTPLEASALAQLAACFDGQLVGWMEWPDYSKDDRSGTYAFPLAEEILEHPLSMDQGELVVPEGPGLGARVNEAVIQRFPYRTGPCSTFQAAGG